jgi:hypothetical protein
MVLGYAVVRERGQLRFRTHERAITSIAENTPSKRPQDILSA